MLNQKIYYYVGWDAVLAIWWEQLWRVMLVNGILYGVAIASIFLTPVIYRTISEMLQYEERRSLALIVLIEMSISLWAGRQSLMDRYARFRLIAESKSMKHSSVYGPDMRLEWSTYVSIWWAQMWRMLLVPATAMVGSFAALVIQHPHAANYTHMLPPALLNICFYAVFVFSLWATRESLGDRYRTFRLVTEPKTFYKDGTNS